MQVCRYAGIHAGMLGIQYAGRQVCRVCMYPGMQVC